MRKFHWLLLPVALFWLTGYQSSALDECLAETTVDCAIDQSAAVAVTIEDRRERARAFAYIARVQADTGREADARKTIDKILALKRDIMDPGTQDGLDSSLARIHGLLGDFGKALKILEGIGNPGRVILTYAWIAQSQATAGDKTGVDLSISRALAAAKDVPREQLAFPFAQIAVARGYMGEKEEALAIADSALKLSGKFNSDPIQARVLTVVAVAENAVGAQGRAKASLDRAKEFLADMESTNAPAKDLASLLAYLAWAQALTGDREGTLASLEPLKVLIRDNLAPYSQSSQLAAIALVLNKAE
jgi:tetratricopeptide (TPR) repeat protein